MTEDIQYCASSFLMYRTVVDRTKCFSQKYPAYFVPFPADRRPIRSADALLQALRERIAAETAGKKPALALSGGIDSAILLALMPENTIAYTFKCIVPGMEVTDETPAAAAYLRYARPDVTHRIIPIYWEDFVQYAPLLMEHKGCPTHSIEVQIYKAALAAKADGCDLMVFGETADCIYGGHSNLLSRDWTLPEFIERWSFLSPERVLKEPLLITSPCEAYTGEDGLVDVPAFLSFFESEPSLNFYCNAAAAAGIGLCTPFAHTVMAEPLDLTRVRRGENKYLVREVFRSLYPGFRIPPKTPMPRPMNEWLAHWPGPSHAMFLPDCAKGLTGDQKWLLYALDTFMHMIEGKK